MEGEYSLGGEKDFAGSEDLFQKVMDKLEKKIEAVKSTLDFKTKADEQNKKNTKEIIRYSVIDKVKSVLKDFLSGICRPLQKT